MLMRQIKYCLFIYYILFYLLTNIVFKKYFFKLNTTIYLTLLKKYSNKKSNIKSI